MVRQDYYQLLGVGRSSSQETLRRAFRLRILESHPDHHPGSALATQQTRRIVEAYRVLGNPLARRVYDLSTAPVDDESGPVAWEAPVYTPYPRQAFGLLTCAALLAVMVFVVLSLVRLVCAESGPVFRPSLAAFEGSRRSTGDIEMACISAAAGPSTADPVFYCRSSVASGSSLASIDLSALQCLGDVQPSAAERGSSVAAR